MEMYAKYGITRLQVHVDNNSTISCHELAQLSTHGVAIVTLLEDDSVIIEESDDSMRTRLRKYLENDKKQNVKKVRDLLG